MSGELPWWLRPAAPALAAAWVISTLSLVLLYSHDSLSWVDLGVQVAVLVALARHLARIEDEHRDAARPRSLKRWGAVADTREPSLLELSRPLVGFMLAAAVFAALGYMAGKTDQRLWAMLGFLLALIFLNAAGWKPMERIAHEWWPEVRYRWSVTMRLLGLCLLANFLTAAVVDLAADGPSLGQLVAAGVAAAGGLWLLRRLDAEEPAATGTG